VDDGTDAHDFSNLQLAERGRVRSTKNGGILRTGFNL